MKPFHVACVVSALAATASGSSLYPPPPSPARLSHTLTPDTQIFNSRRSVRGPLPQLIKRTQALRQKIRMEKRALPRRQLESQLSSLIHLTLPALTKDVDDLKPTIAQLPSGKNDFSEMSLKAVSSNPPNDIPGFVEIAIPDSSAGVARTVSGLAYTSSPDNDQDLELGTSSSHSTQFFLSPINTGDKSILYRLKTPSIEGANTKTVQHCATFATSPAGPLSLKPCGNSSGFSQRFSYDPISGELRPVYSTSTATSPSNDENVPVSQMNKRKLDTPLESETASYHRSKRAATASSNSSAVLYFIPTADDKYRS